MEMQLASTPFGSRRMTAALFSVQQNVQQMPQGLKADKWQLYKWLCEAKDSYAVSDRSLGVLSALLSFHPQQELSASDRLIVFPSNKHLALRAHGMADATLRRHLSALVEAGFIARQDSPNGKRYARRAKGGEMQIAFGFSLAPLLARAHELETAAERVRSEKAALRELRERLTLLRRDITKLITFAMTENLSGNWNDIHSRFRAIVETIPRRTQHSTLVRLVESMESLFAEIDNLLNNNKNVEILSGNESQNERQQIESKPDSQYEEVNVKNSKSISDKRLVSQEPDISLDMVLRACPEIQTYASHPIRQWHQLIETAEKIRGFIGIDTKLYCLANKMLGACNTAITIAYILERYDNIQSPGGYLRILTQKAALGEFTIKAVVAGALHKKYRRE
ncbi:plasmid replication protein RepC [Brucella sp. BE17]|uniref:plasmid replication protein RepC n=1 Tax=Brucella sp. BE17 TaxID=3142977 RepID=UPI0031B9DE6B